MIYGSSECRTLTGTSCCGIVVTITLTKAALLLKDKSVQMIRIPRTQVRADNHFKLKRLRKLQNLLLMKLNGPMVGSNCHSFIMIKRTTQGFRQSIYMVFFFLLVEFLRF